MVVDGVHSVDDAVGFERTPSSRSNDGRRRRQGNKFFLLMPSCFFLAKNFFFLDLRHPVVSCVESLAFASHYPRRYQVE